MKYEKGMQRYAKADKGYEEDSDGAFYKAGDGKMYVMQEKKEKAEVSVDDFQKSLDQLEEIAKADDPESRKEELLAKAQSGEELSEDERDELFKALGQKKGDEVIEEDPPVVKSVEAAMAPENNGEPFQKALDVSEYLDAQHTALTGSLTELAKSMDSSDQRQHQFNLVFAKAFHQVGELVKGMSERLGVIEKQPVRPPKSKGAGQPVGPEVVQKAFAGGDAPADQLSKDDILATLESMMCKSMDDGKDGQAACGEDILHATAKYEQVNQISKAMYAEVTEFQKSQAH